MATAVAVNAQEYKPFKIGVGLGYAMPWRRRGWWRCFVRF